MKETYTYTLKMCFDLFFLCQISNFYSFSYCEKHGQELGNKFFSLATNFVQISVDYQKEEIKERQNKQH